MKLYSLTHEPVEYHLSLVRASLPRSAKAAGFELPGLKATVLRNV
jgi:hypothetical protein